MADRRVALVTGASRGIGEAVALRLAASGFDVAITCHRSIEAARAVCERLEAFGAMARHYCCDLARVDEIDRLMDSIQAAYGRLDVLVNNAAISNTLALEGIDEAEWDRMLDTNLKGVFFCTKRAFAMMKEARYGRIVGISSIAGQRGGLYSGVHYSTSKGGVITMMKCFALLGAPHGITANAVSPGVVETEMSREEGITPAGIPLGRMATPDEVAEAVAYLASESAGYITGATLDVNGGWLMR